MSRRLMTVTHQEDEVHTRHNRGDGWRSNNVCWLVCLMCCYFGGRLLRHERSRAHVKGCLPAESFWNFPMRVCDCHCSQFAFELIGIFKRVAVFIFKAFFSRFQVKSITAPFRSDSKEVGWGRVSGNCLHSNKQFLLHSIIVSVPTPSPRISL